MATIFAAEVPVIDLATVSRFLFDEAALLDARAWEAWLALFAAEGTYWVPLVHGQDDPIDHVSLFYENAMMREVRARRLDQVRAWSQQPLVRASRQIGNIRLLDPDADGTIVVKSVFTLVEWRAPRQRILAGGYTHRLRVTGDGLRIVEKKVDLIDCDAVHETLEAFL
ncbi:MAG TPA: aromatic-ring-hydroxylating dioxygenase subunit beta [Sphingomonas sp.]